MGQPCHISFLWRYRHSISSSSSRIDFVIIFIRHLDIRPDVIMGICPDPCSWDIWQSHRSRFKGWMPLSSSGLHAAYHIIRLSSSFLQVSCGSPHYACQGSLAMSIFPKPPRYRHSDICLTPPRSILLGHHLSTWTLEQA